MTGLKHRDFKPCAICGKGMMHANGIDFYRMRLERFVIDAPAVNRAVGMEMMMGGNARLANVMGPDADLAKLFLGPVDLLICNDCALRSVQPLAVTAEAAFEMTEEKKR